MSRDLSAVIILVLGIAVVVVMLSRIAIEVRMKEDLQKKCAQAGGIPIATREGVLCFQQSAIKEME